MDRSAQVFRAITAMIIALLFIPELFMHGMFFDGITYSTIARNLSIGLGTLWSPMYTSEFQSQFVGHPPLALGIQSLVFRLFGDLFFLEKLYSLITLFCVFAVIFKIWKHFFSQITSWIPILLMLTFPITLWAFRNNLLENTVVIFTTTAVLFFIKAEMKGRIAHYAMGSILVFLAFLCKGPVGLFPLACPYIFQLVFKSKLVNVMPKVTIVLVSTLAICFGTLFLVLPESFHSLSTYMDAQVIPSLLDTGEVTTRSRFSILLILFLQGLPSLVLALLVILLSKSQLKNLASKRALFFLLVGLSASLPLLLTLKQRDFYLIPSIPFFALSLASIIERSIGRLTNLINVRWSRILIGVSILGIIVSVSLSVVNFGKYLRDEQLIQDVQSLTEHLTPGTTLGSSVQNCYDWTLVAYLMRYGQLSISCKDEFDHFLQSKNSKINRPSDALELNKFFLIQQTSSIAE